MAWPAVSGSTVGYKAQGVTTIRWGTDGLLTSPAPSGGFYTVTRFAQKPLVENIKLPNGTGITATRVQLIDGTEWTITVRDDTRMTPPVIGNTVTIVDAAGLHGTPGVAYSATILDPSYEAAPKQAGERTIIVERLKLIEG